MRTTYIIRHSHLAAEIVAESVAKVATHVNSITAMTVSQIFSLKTKFLLPIRPLLQPDRTEAKMADIWPNRSFGRTFGASLLL